MYLWQWPKQQQQLPVENKVHFKCDEDEALSWQQHLLLKSSTPICTAIATTVSCNGSRQLSKQIYARGPTLSQRAFQLNCWRWSVCRVKLSQNKKLLQLFKHSPRIAISLNQLLFLIKIKMAIVLSLMIDWLIEFFLKCKVAPCLSL